MQFCSDLSTSLSHRSGTAMGMWDIAWISPNVISVYCSQVGAQLIPSDISLSSSPSTDGYYSSKFINGSPVRPRQLGAIMTNQGTVRWGVYLYWLIAVKLDKRSLKWEKWLKATRAQCQSWSLDSVLSDFSVAHFNYQQWHNATRLLSQ